MDLIYEDPRSARRKPRQNKGNESSPRAVKSTTATTTDAATEESDASPTDDEEKLKCNSRALKKLMMEVTNLLNMSSFSLSLGF